MDKKLISQYKQTFDDIMHVEDGVEFWYARELQNVLGYKTWESFTDTILRAQHACSNSGVLAHDHFRDVPKMVSIGSKAQRDIGDIMLTRYACYLIAQNGDPRKTEIAFAQTYFALQTRKQELIEQRLEAMNRLQLREQLKTAEKRLSENIYERGVDEFGFGKIRSKGDAALFGGHTTDEMKYRYRVKGNRPLADFLPPVTIAAKSLATEMTNLNIDEKDLYGEDPITNEHVQNNRSVRKMLIDRGIRPETLSPAEDIKKLERRVKSEEKKLSKSETLPDLDK